MILKQNIKIGHTVLRILYLTTTTTTDLNSEKRSIQGHWKKQEKQIEKVLLNTNFMYSCIKGIAGNAINIGFRNE